MRKAFVHFNTIRLEKIINYPLTKYKLFRALFFFERGNPKKLSNIHKLIVGIGRNVNKTPMFSEEQRLKWLREIYKDDPKVEAVVYDGLTVDCCKSVGANFILRGIRYVNDFEY